ncbi:MAG: hypothetical protein DME50_08100 [Verrucomicrobia bacterium]|nr:MAG: hypothetical protein DME50_08100 [Verrucomicrobiota bacterium]
MSRSRFHGCRTLLALPSGLNTPKKGRRFGRRWPRSSKRSQCRLDRRGSG